MRMFISRVSKLLISLFLFYMFITNDNWLDFIYVNTLIYTTIVLLFLLGAFWIGRHLVQ